MSEKAYTDGPWLYDRADGSLAPRNDSARNIVGRFHCGRLDDGSDARPVKADADILAAAPEMFAALKLAALELDRLREHGTTMSAVEQEIAGVIRRAKGKS